MSIGLSLSNFHHTKGRLRFTHQTLKDFPDVQLSVLRSLMANKGVHEGCARRLTGSIIIYYHDTVVSPEELLKKIRQELEGVCFFSTKPQKEIKRQPQHRPASTQRTTTHVIKNTYLYRTIFQALSNELTDRMLQKVVDVLLTRLLTTVIGK